MSKEHILIIEDETDIQELIQFNLEKERYRITATLTGEEGVSQAKSSSPDLILLDLMLPGIDGFEVCRRLKSDTETKKIPIVMLTAKGEESDIVSGLELGADDYITKPFQPRVLIARIRSVLRRAHQDFSEDASVMSIHNIILDTSRFKVTVEGEPVDLTATEFYLLKLLMRRPGWVFTRGQIIDAVKGTDYPVTDRSVDVQITGLRKKLQSAGSYIETVRGIGYRLKE
jgi:two-component system alkaline phosphatase synthesis response regulator PhoP